MPLILALGLSGILFTAQPLIAETDRHHGHQFSPGQEMLHSAEHATDNAWDAFHKSALGGTLASPEVQTAIEQDLQASRVILRKARRAYHQENLAEVRRLTEEIKNKVQKIITQSRMEKK